MGRVPSGLRRIESAMNSGRNRWLIRLAAVAVGGLALWMWTSQQAAQNVPTIENQSGQALAQLRITFAGQTKTFQNVPTGTKLIVPLGVKSDDAFTADVRLANGIMLRWNGPVQEGRSLILLPTGAFEVRKNKD